jgi:hypothetical protein
MKRGLKIYKREKSTWGKIQSINNNLLDHFYYVSSLLTLYL